MTLASYRKKRHFDRTPEPLGAAATRHRKGEFQGELVIQCHAASHLHYDFRLELDGVLKSWAVPKGPSLDPAEKRLAIEVEDHPLEYGSFEGTIPAGQYGAGTVLLWDRGHWQADGDPHEGLRAGKLEFHLEGTKLRGGWVLVRSRISNGKKNSWLLIKRRDEYAQPGSGASILDEAPLSVKSGRDMDEITAGRKRHNASGSHSKSPAHTNGKPSRGKPSLNGNGHVARKASTKSKQVAKHADVSQLPGAVPADLPRIFRPQLAEAVREAPSGDQWLHETKFDGNRIAVRIDGTTIDLLSRRMQSWTARLPHVVEAAKALGVRSALFDGEAVVLQPDGSSNFQDLQNAFREGRGREIVYYAFDLLYLDGYDLTGCRLADRNRVLADVLPPRGTEGAIRYTEHTVGDGPKAFAKACKQRLEGIVSKRLDAPYVPGRRDHWLKVKCVNRSEFVIGGYTDPEGARKHFGALLVGYYEGPRLVYAGRVGTGFDAATLRELSQRLKLLEQNSPPFAPSETLQAREKGVHWIAPVLVAQVQFRDWTREGILRQPSFQGLREDKKPSEVSRELPIDHDGAAGDSAASPVHRNSAAKRSAAGRRSAAGKRSAARGNHQSILANLAALDVHFTHPDKVLYKEQGVTKIELAAYYARVAEWMLPHVAGRPLMLVRCPEGDRGECFHQKHADQGGFQHLRLVPVKESGKTEKYLVVNDLPGLLSLVQMGTLEIHAWGARADDIERPDRLVFDLDPDTAVPWPRVVESARQLKAFFDDLGFKTFLKTTGGKGLHIVLPILRKHEWPEVKEFCQTVAAAVAQGDPERYTAKMSKAARKGKIFIDYLRNQRGATSVAAYSTRARPGAPISVPVSWAELDAELRSDSFTLSNISERLATLRHDPWAAIADVRQSISASIKKKLGLERRV